MKRYIYIICLMVSFTVLTSCSKSSDPAPVSPVVGRWELNRGLLSGFVSPYQSLNTRGLDLYNYDLGSYTSTIDVRTDNSFTENYKSGGLVDDANGTWDYTNTQLNLKYDDGTTGTFSYSSSKGIEELTSPTQSISLPLSATATAVGNVQFVYRK